MSKNITVSHPDGSWAKVISFPTSENESWLHPDDELILALANKIEEMKANPLTQAEEDFLAEVESDEEWAHSVDSTGRTAKVLAILKKMKKHYGCTKNNSM